jgi:hypothetical protein
MIFFWIPTRTTFGVGVTILALFTSLLIRSETLDQAIHIGFTIQHLL